MMNQVLMNIWAYRVIGTVSDLFHPSCFVKTKPPTHLSSSRNICDWTMPRSPAVRGEISEKVAAQVQWLPRLECTVDCTCDEFTWVDFRLYWSLSQVPTLLFLYIFQMIMLNFGWVILFSLFWRHHHIRCRLYLATTNLQLLPFIKVFR